MDYALKGQLHRLGNAFSVDGGLAYSWGVAPGYDGMRRWGGGPAKIINARLGWY